jgi:hypothetical protein
MPRPSVLTLHATSATFIEVGSGVRPGPMRVKSLDAIQAMNTYASNASSRAPPRDHHATGVSQNRDTVFGSVLVRSIGCAGTSL